MSFAVKSGIILAVSVIVFSILIAATGLHERPLVSGVGFLVVVIVVNVGAVYVALKQTASTTAYGGQLLNGLLLGVVAGVLIFAGSLLVTQVLFPDYIAEARDATIDWMQSTGMPQAQLDAQVAKLEASGPVRQATNGLIGTIVTSVLVAAIVAIFVRKK